MTKSFTLRLCHEDLVILARKSMAAEVSGLNDLTVASVSLRDLANTGTCTFCAAPSNPGMVLVTVTFEIPCSVSQSQTT